MKQLSTKLIAILIAIFGVVAPATTFALTQPTYAQDKICELSTVPQSTKDAYGCTNTGSKEEFSNTIQGILNGIIAALGIVAVVFIVYGGILYMTSTGDAQKIKQGKQTIFYAAVGLIICAISFALVNFVIIKIIGGQ